MRIIVSIAGRSIGWEANGMNGTQQSPGLVPIYEREVYLPPKQPATWREGQDDASRLPSRNSFTKQRGYTVIELLLVITFTVFTFAVGSGVAYVAIHFIKKLW